MFALTAAATKPRPVSTTTMPIVLAGMERRAFLASSSGGAAVSKPANAVMS
jgi:hypothetical protein